MSQFMYTTKQKKDLESLREAILSITKDIDTNQEISNFFKNNFIDIINYTIDDLESSIYKSLEKCGIQAKEIITSTNTNNKSMAEIEEDIIQIRNKILAMFGENDDHSFEQKKMYQIKTYIDSSDTTICNLNVYELAKNSHPFLIPIEQFYSLAGFASTHPLHKCMSKFATFSAKTIEKRKQDGIPEIFLQTFSHTLVAIDTDIIEWLGYKGKTGYTNLKKELRRKKIFFTESKRGTIQIERSQVFAAMLSVIKDTDKIEEFINFSYIGPKYIEYQEYFYSDICSITVQVLKYIDCVRKMIGTIGSQINTIDVQNHLLQNCKSSMQDVKLLRVLEEQKLKNVIEREKAVERATVELDIKLLLLEREKENVKRLREELAEDCRKNSQRKRSRR